MSVFVAECVFVDSVSALSIRPELVVMPVDHKSCKASEAIEPSCRPQPFLRAIGTSGKKVRSNSIKAPSCWSYRFPGKRRGIQVAVVGVILVQKTFIFFGHGIRVVHNAKLKSVLQGGFYRI